MSEQDLNMEEGRDSVVREPQANSVATPAWPFILMVVLLWCGMRYFDAHGGAFDNRVFAKNMSSPPPVLGMSPEQEALAKGKTVYLQYCAACHQPHGKGVPGQFPPLSGSDWVNNVGPNRMIRLVLDGVSGPITVNGAVYNNAMVPWRPMLSDEQIAWVVSYVRNDPEWGNTGTFVSAAEVKAIREATVSHAGQPYSAGELLSSPDSN
ncbi:MAG: cytochrome c [Verrucomicrobiae bacterium]|jgi:mono/diheme cytochrome c family protein|nr:cytochrome c [Verrucomicrobiae bacterium]